MGVLTASQRSTLESVVINARKVSEKGARNALHTLAVDEAEPYGHMSPEQRTLRNRLRSKARLLGDVLHNNGKQEINHLAYELAYEYWHKMLFAKFLEANNLLIHSKMKVPVSMEDCEAVAKEEGFTNKWEAAASYASKMLPAIFRVNDPLMQINYASNDRINLEDLLDKLDNYIFTADDALGWVYQFWQSEAKAAINASNEKIDGAKLPAVTQLFTEPYMVHFLIDNTLGAWWVSRNPGVTPPIKFEYLRLLDDGKPAAGAFEGWPDKTAQVTSLDPCMGSGHFVASLFPVFAKLRMHEEGLTAEEATDKVITENLHGLELDARCTQIAAFNLALTAWKFIGRFIELPEMNLACSGIAPTGKKEDWIKLVAKEQDEELKQKLENGIGMLFDHFQLAPELGSLLDPSTIKPDAFTASFEELQPVLVKALAEETDKDQLERGVIAAGIAKAGEILAHKYSLIITNVPYLSRGKQASSILDYCEKYYPEAKGNIATVFLLRMIKSAFDNGLIANVTLQDWLFQPTYKTLRKNVLNSTKFSIIARIGAKGFQTPMYDFNVMLLSLFKTKPSTKDIIIGINAAEANNTFEKALIFKESKLIILNQLDQLNNPDSRISLESEKHSALLSKITDSLVGLQTSDDPMFIVSFWETSAINKNIWEFLQNTPASEKLDSGMSFLVRWELGKGLLLSLPSAYPTKGLKALGKNGIAINRMGKIYPYTYGKERFHQNVAVFLPYDEKDLPAIWCFCNTDEFNESIRNIDQSLKVTNSTLIKIPFDIEHWQKVAAEKYPNGLPKPYSDDPTQWLFHGYPIKTANSLQVSIARLLGYSWPAESDSEMELADEAKELVKAVKAFDEFTDDDGIMCIPAVNGEVAGTERLRKYLQAVYSDAYNKDTIIELLKKEGAKESNLDDWLRNSFFEQHCKVFQNRPFIWHISDGRKDGFGALVNYHKLTKENLQKLIYTYLGDWIRQCELKVKSGESGADGLLSAAKKLKDKLELILEGESPYDIFVRWKKLEEQPIGWDPDLNDGVRLNIRPFITAEVLKKKPNIKWGVDRGNNPPGTPWGEKRDNDKHLPLADKRAARENKKIVLQK
jgi:hypothetical protein